MREIGLDPIKLFNQSFKVEMNSIIYLNSSANNPNYK